MRRIVMLWMVIIFLFPAAAYATHHEGSWQRLDKISDEALQLAKNKRFQEAKEVLDYFSNEFLKLNARDRLHSMDELRAITVTHEKAVKTVTASTLPAEARIDQVAQFRLVIDAIRSDYQPLWTEMEQAVMGAFQQMEDAVKKGDKNQFPTALAKFLHEYEIIEPSVKIDVAPERAKKVDADITNLQAEQFQALPQAKQIEVLAQTKADVEALFADVKKDEADPSLWWVMISTGGIIVATLTYVGFRKYRGEKQKTHAREKE